MPEVLGFVQLAFVITHLKMYCLGCPQSSLAIDPCSQKEKIAPEFLAETELFITEVTERKYCPDKYISWWAISHIESTTFCIDDSTLYRWQDLGICSHLLVMNTRFQLHQM